MTSPTCLRSAPVLQVSDLEKSVAFYRDVLGFTAGRLWGEPPCFCIVGQGQVTIMLDAARDPQSKPINQYWAAYVYVDDVAALHQAFSAAGAEIVRGPEDMPYGCRDFDLRDPDGHLIAFGQDLEPGDEGPGL